MFEKKIFKTPKDGLNFLMLTFFVYITAPIFKWFSLENDLANEKFSVNADSIGLGLVQFTFALILFAPFVSAFVGWVLWKYPLEVSLFGFNCQRLLWSFVWTLVFGFLFFDSLAFGLIGLAKGNFSSAIENLIIGYLCLVFRASIIFRKGEKQWAF